MGVDRGVLARIDRKLLAGLGHDETYRMVRIPVTPAKWSTWKRYCETVGISMGRATVALIERELTSIFGDQPDDAAPVFAHQAQATLAAREAQLAARKHNLEEIERRQRTRSGSLRRWESELEAREQRLELASKLAAQRRHAAPKTGRNERCPCGSGLKYKHCHGLTGRRPNSVPR